MVRRTEDKDRFGILENDKEKDMTLAENWARNNTATSNPENAVAVSKTKDMTFGEALEAMKNGHGIRESWWEDGIYVTLSADLNSFQMHSLGITSGYYFKPFEMCSNRWEVWEAPVVNPQFEVWYEIHKNEFLIHSKKDMEWAFNAGMVEVQKGDYPPSKLKWLKGLMDKANQGFDNGETWANAMAVLWSLANEAEPYAEWGTIPKSRPHDFAWALDQLVASKKVKMASDNDGFFYYRDGYIIRDSTKYSWSPTLVQIQHNNWMVVE